MNKNRESTKHRYSYRGPVMLFEKMITDHWRGETVATSEAKAKNNLRYQVKQQLGKVPGSAITLPGDVKVIE